MGEFAFIRTSTGSYLRITSIALVSPIHEEQCEIWVGRDVFRSDESAEHFLLRCREILDDLELTRKSQPGAARMYFLDDDELEALRQYRQVRRLASIRADGGYVE